MDLGLRFKKYRTRSKLKQKEAAELMGIKNYQLGDYETNRSEPSIDILKKMSKIYGVSIDKLVGNNIKELSIDNKAYSTPEDLEKVIKDFVEYYESNKE